MARTVPYETRLHGDTLPDPYRWLREKTNPETIAYLEAENRYSDAALAPTTDLRARLYQEMVSRIKETDQTAPYPFGGFLYSTRTEQGKQYGVLCRRDAKVPDAPEEVMLDLNALAEGKKFLGLNVAEVSDDGRLLAFATDETGFRQYTLQVKDLRTGQLLPDRLERVDFALWSADGQSLFYIVEDDAKRPYRLLRHVLGRDVKEDELLFEEKDELYNLGAGASSDRTTLLTVSASKTTTEAHCLRRDEPPGTGPRLLLPREEGHEYYPDLYAGRWLLRTNKDAKNFRLVSAPLDDPRPERWREFLPHRPAVKLDDFRCFERHAVVEVRENGLPGLEVVDPPRADDIAQPRRVPLPEPAYELSEDQNHEFATNKFRFAYQSLTTPKTIFELDLDTGERRLLKRQEVPGGYDPAAYVSERLEVTATDGTRVPVSLVYKRGTPRDGSAPCLLYGYGSYGLPMPVSFNSNRLSLLDRGVIYAIAHVRGGGELGEPWHDQGKMMFKRNTFTDFINCAEALVRERYTSPARLAIQGGSAGGLLMGAVVNMRPELFRAVVMQVPFVDVMNTMLDASLPLTVDEYLEWGDPHEKAAFGYMRSYSPYDNLQARDYPATLVMTSLNEQPGHVLGTGQVRGQTTHAPDGHQPALAPHQHGRRPRRGQRSLRRAEGNHPRVQLRAGATRGGTRRTSVHASDGGGSVGPVGCGGQSRRGLFRPRHPRTQAPVVAITLRGRSATAGTLTGTLPLR